ncbi:MAG: hypothetical protein JRI23_05880 [Deltaproteobacteria bacterium]|jgi:hypothetical protein|nr:hypothetical protein [Deltaproteobacteria bacterium]MBW2531092.1 hypothetical protein [Deltaproteobacteria bacterium]
MSDEYLWDRTGLPEPDELELEALLGPLGFRTAAAPAAASPVVAPTAASRWLTGALAVAACVGFGLWIADRAPEQQAIVADVRIPADSDGAADQAEEPMPATPAPAGSARQPSEVFDPWSRDRPARRPRRARPSTSMVDEARKPTPSGIIDPWVEAPPEGARPSAGSPPSGAANPDDSVIDPWARSAPAKDGSGSKGLSPSELQQVVSTHQGSVRAACWMPSVERAAPDAPDEARVSVSLVIGADGRVEQASPSGDPSGYPGLGRCIAALAKRWTFPSRDVSTSAVIPFVFVRPSAG